MWDRAQRRRLLDLTTAAEIPVDHTTLIDEPVAAGVAWLTMQSATRSIGGRLLVVDVGGGTLDIAVMDVTGGPRPRVSVLTSVGLPEAGDALDMLVADELTAMLGLDLDGLADPGKARGAIRRGAREAKLRLSSRDTYPVVLNPIFFGTRVPAIRYSRAQLEERFAPQLARAEQMVWHALRIARLTHVRGAGTQAAMRTTPEQLAGDVTYVLLCGGMSRMPVVRRRLRELFQAAEVFDDAGHAPDEAIVAGLADTVGYDGLSMHRPAFDVVLEWADGTREMALYEAYTPLFEGWQISTGQSLLGHETRVEKGRLPRQGAGQLRVRTPDGRPLDLIPTQRGPAGDTGVPFGTYPVVFKLYTDGRLHLTDGRGHAHEFRVEGWLPVEGADTTPVPVPVPDPKVHYPFNLED